MIEGYAATFSQELRTKIDGLEPSFQKALVRCYEFEGYILRACAGESGFITDKTHPLYLFVNSEYPNFLLLKELARMGACLQISFEVWHNRALHPEVQWFGIFSKEDKSKLASIEFRINTKNNLITHCSWSHANSLLV